jgi:hypothetical protein
MTFKSTIEALSEVSIDSSDACPAAGFHLNEAELDGVTGGMEGWFSVIEKLVPAIPIIISSI